MTLPHPYSTEHSITPAVRNPYYIVAPRYIRTSAGIKALHMLCHSLNRIGERAYMILHPHFPEIHGINRDWLTPILTTTAIKRDHERGLTPITIYGESIAGNLFNAPLVVRYILNFPGLVGGDETYDADEYLLAYSKVLAQTAGYPDAVLHIPASDTNIFNPEPRRARSGTCFYAAKYQHHHGAKTFPITQSSVEITRDLPNSQTPEEIANLFRQSELFYCYENSALIIEALLCECPVVMLPNPYLTASISEHEMGNDGVAWGATDDEIKRARETVKLGRQRYLNLYETFWDQLNSFVLRTQSLAVSISYDAPVRLSYSDERTLLSWISDATRMLDFVVQTEGWLKAIAHSAGWIKRHGFNISK